MIKRNARKNYAYRGDLWHVCCNGKRNGELERVSHLLRCKTRVGIGEEMRLLCLLQFYSNGQWQNLPALAYAHLLYANTVEVHY